MSDQWHIVKLSRPTTMHPAQWEGVLADGRPVFVHYYKWGDLTVRIGEAGESMGQVLNRAPWFEAAVASWSEPMIDLGEVLRATGMTIAEPLEPMLA